MNIFYVDECPSIAARSLVDKHVVKMILESCQLLATAHRVLDGQKQIVLGKNGRKITRYVLSDNREQVLPKSTHINHPCAVWVRENKENYSWLWQHTLVLNTEYTFRFGKKHAYSGKVLYALYNSPYECPIGSFTSPPTAMPKEYIVEGDSVSSYRNYYRLGKSHLHKYSVRQAPEWMVSP